MSNFDYFRSRGSMYAGEESGKSCCGVMVTQTVSIRWFIVMIAFVGICCAVVGTVLGAMRSSGREHLTVSLLMIGKLFYFGPSLAIATHRSNTQPVCVLGNNIIIIEK